MSKETQTNTKDSKCPCAKCFIAVDAAKLLNQKDILINKLQAENDELKEALASAE